MRKHASSSRTAVKIGNWRSAIGNRFTLIELLCVCGILIFIMGIGIGVYSAANRKMGEAKCKAMIAKMSIALENYKNKMGYYPQAETASYFYVDKFYPDSTTADSAGTRWDYTINNEITINSNELVTNLYTTPPARDIREFSRGVWKDPFGNKFFYQCPGKHNPTTFDLYSQGPDQTGTIAAPGADDLTNWTQ